MAEEGGLRYYEAEVDIDWRGYTGFELEGTEFDGGDLVELEN